MRKINGWKEPVEDSIDGWKELADAYAAKIIKNLITIQQQAITINKLKQKVTKLSNRN